jgi:hypothetical protein
VSRPIVVAVEVTGDAVQVGDVLEIGGLPHAVADIRAIHGPDGRHRRRLAFADGNAYFGAPGTLLTVIREYRPRPAAALAHHRLMAVRRGGR